MKHTSILSNASVRSVALAGIMIFGVTSASHAQTGVMAQLGAPVSAQGGSIVAAALVKVGRRRHRSKKFATRKW